MIIREDEKILKKIDNKTSKIDLLNKKTLSYKKIANDRNGIYYTDRIKD